MLRIMLIDDEEVVIRGLEYILSKYQEKFQVVGTATSGLTAVKLLEDLDVDVIISDIKMPDITGLELLETVKKAYPQIFVVMLSGHAQFDYAVEALRKGAYDYLTKPCKHQNIVSLLDKIAIDKEEKQTTSQEIAQLRNHYSIQKKEVSQLKIKESLIGTTSHIIDWLDMNTCLVATMMFVERRAIESKKKRIEEWLSENYASGTYEAVLIDYGISILFAPMVDYKSITNKLYQLKLCLNREGYRMQVGISDMGKGSESLNTLYAQSLEICDFLSFNNLDLILSNEAYNKIYKSKSDCGVFEKLSDEAIVKAIFMGDTQTIETLIHDLRKEVNKDISYYFSVKSVHNVVKQMMALVEKRLTDKELSLEQIFEQRVECVYEVERLYNLNQVINWCENMMKTITVYIEKNVKELPITIQEAITYINHNYYKDLSMKGLADILCLNPWYFSDLFKTKVGKSFSDYVTEVRIAHAIELLKETNLRNYDIAEKVGFKNATYFNVVFKKNVGMTPKVFRNKM